MAGEIERSKQKDTYRDRDTMDTVENELLNSYSNLIRLQKDITGGLIKYVIEILLKKKVGKH